MCLWRPVNNTGHCCSSLYMYVDIRTLTVFSFALWMKGGRVLLYRPRARAAAMDKNKFSVFEVFMKASQHRRLPFGKHQIPITMPGVSSRYCYLLSFYTISWGAFTILFSSLVIHRSTKYDNSQSCRRTQKISFNLKDPVPLWTYYIIHIG